MSKCKNVSIRLKRYDIQERAKYCVEEKVYGTANITVCRSDFNQIDENNFFVSISLDRSNFVDIEKVPRMELRKRKLLAPSIPPAKKPRHASKALVRISPLQKLIVEPKHSLKEGMIVLAQMKWYPPWPAQIQTLRPSCVEVIYFGENEKETVPYDKVGSFEKNYSLIRSHLHKNGYLKAVKSSEGILKYPHIYQLHFKFIYGE